MTSIHHIFVSFPATAGLGAHVARSLARGGERPRGVQVNEGMAGRAAVGLSGFFAQMRPRAEAFAAKLDGPVGRLVVPVLPYDSYFPALWRHQAARRAMPDFEALAPGLLGTARGWAEVVEDLIAALKPAQTILLPAPVAVDDVLSALVPEGAARATPGLDPRLPDTALAMLQRLYRSGVQLPPRQVSRLMAFHLRQPQPAPLAAFAPLDVAQLRRRYSRDLARLERLPGVRLGAGVGLAYAAE